MKTTSFGQGVKIFLIVIGVIAFVGIMAKESGEKCIRNGCNNKRVTGSNYCRKHKVYDDEYSSDRSSSYNTDDNSSTTSFSNDSTRSNDSTIANDYSNSANNYNNSSKTGTTDHSSYSNTTWKSTSTKENTYNTYNSYDEGYDDIYMDEEYDSERYDRDSDYADGVDDAMDEFDEDY